MHDVKVLANVFKRNTMVIGRQVEGLSHTDSLLQPEFRGNCLNYVLGHIVVHREKVMEILGVTPIMDPTSRALYDYGSDPITEDVDGVLELDSLMDLLSQMSELIISAVRDLSPEALERDVKLGDSSATLGQRLEFFGWHEAYHVGQTEYLRQLAGTDDKVI